MRSQAAILIGFFLGALSLSNGASAQSISDGRTLSDRCASFQLTNPAAGLGCRGYIGAVADILAAGNSIDSYRACPPAEIGREKLVKTVTSWLDMHQGSLSSPAFNLVAQAIAESYPCAKE